MIYYKKRNIALLISSILIGGILLMFELFPCGVNEKSKNMVSFSRESGFYDEEFMLEMYSNGKDIYYTLDGSIPDRKSIKYDGPILISDASKNENLYSMRTDVSAGFQVEEIEKIGYEIPPGYQVPNYKVDKATIIRAVAYDKLGKRSEVVDASYFVGFSDKKGYENVNILSIITDPDNLFDSEKGIYVTGDEYEKYVNEYRKKAIWSYKEEYWVSWPSNYRNKGKNWEREAICHFFNESREMQLSQICGIRIHGGHSRGYTPKSLNLYARDEYGNDVFQEDLFGTGYFPTAMTLFQGGDEYRTRAKDYLIANEIKELNVVSMNYIPYVMFLNGEYWGIYWLNEKYNKDFISYKYDVKVDNIIMMKNFAVEEGEVDDIKYYDNMIKFCSEADLTLEENFKKVCEMIDLESYLDYNALMIYLARGGDWPMYNTALWRVKKLESRKFGDGKWRWMIFDLNSTGFEIRKDSIQYTMDNDLMFKNMMTNDAFRNMFCEKLEEIIGMFDYNLMNDKVEDYRYSFIDKTKKHDKRFFGDDSALIFNEELDAINEFFKERGTYLYSIIDKYR